MPPPPPKLFQPITLGPLTLSHRIVLAPLTRCRANENHVPLHDIVKEYYSQRGSTPGTLLITEATFIAPEAGGYPNIPGIWSEEQVGVWKEIVDGVHEKGSSIFLQLWALGRTAVPSVLTSETPSFPFICVSDVPTNAKDPSPRPLTTSEIHDYVRYYATAASNAVHKAGFDGVEIHGANGYLVDQFLQDVTNRREDGYGGSVEGRTRFGLEVVEAVVREVGEERVGIRLSPWSRFNGMGMDDPIPTFSYFVSQISKLYPSFAYIHVVEPRVDGNVTREDDQVDPRQSNDFLREIWGRRVYIAAGGFTKETAVQFAEEHENEMIAFGRWFISNPDLPVRLMKDIKLTPYERDMFYTAGDASGRGYSDYGFAWQEEA